MVNRNKSNKKLLETAIVALKALDRVLLRGGEENANAVLDMCLEHLQALLKANRNVVLPRLDEYEAYYDDTEKANRIPLSYSAWLERY